ncbi:hypothetical protein [Novosphingobium sp. TH158]|uniref:hypothetical protein n=1 Tax=Novosphingobium sp. TH158 TaxID=2067455 RepID=UPI000C79F908|nr:hypothetical protein [Novosphingobium sp. TH158]PLK26371.1 hypothetical protein C0V78_05375 [Novosphingobium sp. TH158]
MTERSDRLRLKQGAAMVAVALAACLPAAVALAQPVTDFRLQPRETATPRPQGPVDADAPVVRTPPRETPSASPAPPPASATPSATTSAPPRPAASASAPQQPQAQPKAAPSASAPALPPAPAAATPAEAAPVAVPSVLPESQGPVVLETFEPAPGLARGTEFAWWWLAAPAALLVLLAGWLISRRRKPADEEQEQPEDEAQAPPALVATPPLSRQPAAVAPKPAPSSPAPAPAPSPAVPVAAPVAKASGGSLFIDIDVGRMSATLINATLTWQLTVENHGTETLGPVMVAGDMIAAHASLPVEQQLATDGQPLELLGEINLIEPGDQVTLKGEFRVPLAAINPIRAGSALLFIPLIRFRVEAAGSSRLATFVVGETPPVAAAALLPFRLDLGPRVWPNISHRQVDREAVAA